MCIFNFFYHYLSYPSLNTMYYGNFFSIFSFCSDIQIIWFIILRYMYKYFVTHGKNIVGDCILPNLLHACRGCCTCTNITSNDASLNDRTNSFESVWCMCGCKGVWRLFEFGWGGGWGRSAHVVCVHVCCVCWHRGTLQVYILDLLINLMFIFSFRLPGTLDLMIFPGIIERSSSVEVMGSLMI